MTLRERIESYVESLGGEMDGFELSQDGLRAILDAILTETCVEDAERDRLARIGKLVEGLAITCGSGRVVIDCEGDTLLDALEALKQKTEGL